MGGIMKKSVFIKGATILSLAGIIVKILGAFFKIPLANMIGDTGMAYFTPSYYIYSFFLTLATAGIPVAISKLVSESRTLGNDVQAQRVFILSSRLMLALGAVSFAIVFFGAELFANALQLPEIIISMKSIAPALLIVPLLASYRGYFQGIHNMMPTAISQIVEQGFRVIIGLLFAYILYAQVLELPLAYSPEALGAAGATFGAVAGAFGGLIAIVLIYFIFKKKGQFNLSKTDIPTKRDSWQSIVKTIVMISIPITIGATLMPITNLVDAAIVNPRLLAAGFAPETAKSLYGQLTGFAGPITNLPLVFTQAIAVTMVPLAAAAYKMREQQSLETQVIIALRLSVIIALPCMVGLIILAKPILLMLYPSQIESAMNAVPCLMILAFGVFPLAIAQTMTGVLQGIGKQSVPVKNLGMGLLLKVILTWILVASPFFNIVGAAIGTVIGYFLAAILNTISVIRYTKITLHFKQVFLRPLLPTFIMAMATIIVYEMMMFLFNRNSISTLTAVFIAVIIYGIALILTKVITKDEIERIPFPAKLMPIKNWLLKRL